MNGFELLKRCALLVHPDLSGIDKAVLCVLAAHYNMNDGCAFPSLVTVQKESGCGSMHTVIKAISRLKAAGLITVRKSFAMNARYFFNVHSIATSDITAKSDSNAESDSNVKSDNHSIATSGNHSIATFGNLTKKKNKKEEQKRVLDFHGADPQAVTDWLAFRKRRRTEVTQLVIDQHFKEANKAGISLGEAFEYQVNVGWTAFRADWYEAREHRQSEEQSRSIFRVNHANGSAPKQLTDKEEEEAADDLFGGLS